MRATALAFALVALVSLVSSKDDGVLFLEKWDDDAWNLRWRHSDNSKYTGRFRVGKPNDWKNNGLRIPDPNKHYGISALVPEPIDPSDGLVIQYEVRHSKTYTCGGSYIKLLTHEEGFTPEGLHDQTPYSIMFGPDKCGEEMRVHVIFRHWNPNKQKIEERQLVAKPLPVADNHTHVYTLRLTQPSTFEVLVDNKAVIKGDLLTESAFSPSFYQPQMIVDPEAKKPEDWVDAKRIPDPRAVKPANWDEREFIPDTDAPLPEGWLEGEPITVPDPSAQPPADWDEAKEGPWQAPLIKNPKCTVGCGKWTRPLKRNPKYQGKWEQPWIDNPRYVGPWMPPYIENPDFFEDRAPLMNIGRIGAVAVEVWTTDPDYYFDNLVIARFDDVPKKLRTSDYAGRVQREKAAAKERAAKLASKEAKTKKVPLTGVPKAVVDFLNKPALKPARPYLRPVIKAIRKFPAVAFVVVGLPPLLALTVGLALTIYRARQASFRRAVLAAYAKKYDIKPEDAVGERLGDLAGERVPEPQPDPPKPPPGPQSPDSSDAEGEGAKKGGSAKAAAGAATAATGIKKGSAGGSSDEFELVEKPVAKDEKKKVPVVEEEESEEEEEAGGKPRRRTRRAA